MLRPELQSCDVWAVWGHWDLAHVWRSSPPAAATGPGTSFAEHSWFYALYLLSKHICFFVKMTLEEKKKKKAACECCRLVCKLGDSWKSCSVALSLLMSMCLIYNQSFVCWPRHPRKQNNGFQLWQLHLGNHVGFCGFGTGPNICRVKCSLGDSDVQPRWKTMEIDYSIQIKEFRENTQLLRVFPQEQV